MCPFKNQEDKLAWEREYYSHYRELGICTSCRKQPAQEGSTRCYDCDELRKEKYYKPRTEETRSKAEAISSPKRNKIVLEELRKHRILCKEIGKSLYRTPKGVVFHVASITIYRHGLTKSPTYRIRNEFKREADYFVGYFPEDGSIYVLPVEGTPPAIYFQMEDVEPYKSAFELLATPKPKLEE